jgi:hypothetical protein
MSVVVVISQHLLNVFVQLANKRGLKKKFLQVVTTVLLQQQCYPVQDHSHVYRALDSARRTPSCWTCYLLKKNLILKSNFWAITTSPFHRLLYFRWNIHSIKICHEKAHMDTNCKLVEDLYSSGFQCLVNNTCKGKEGFLFIYLLIMVVYNLNSELGLNLF